MIEYYYLQERCRSLRQGPLGPNLDGFAGLLFRLGFTRCSGRPRIRIVGYLSKWLAHRQLKAKDLNEQRVADFLKARWKKFPRRTFEAPALTLLLKHLRQTEIIPQPLPPPDSALDLIQQDYAQFLSRERGLAQITMRGYLRITRRFLSARFGAGKILLNQLSFQDVVRFILGHMGPRTPGDVRLVRSVLRSFFGFLYQRGHLATNFARAVPPVAARHSTEPSPTLAPDQIKRLLIRCCGKGRKERCIPLRKDSIAALRAWSRECGGQSADALFPSSRGQRLSRDGVEYLLAKHVATARQSCPSLKKKRVSPHVLRHSTAMNLLQHGVDCSVIALWLGHESIETTQVYLHADLELKERALAQTEPFHGRQGRYRPSDQLLAFLQGL